ERRAPYASCPRTGFQTPFQMNDRPKWRTAGHAPSMTFQMIAAMTTSVRTAAPPVTYLRASSPIRSARCRVRRRTFVEAGGATAATAPVFPSRRPRRQGRSPLRHITFTSGPPPRTSRACETRWRERRCASTLGHGRAARGEGGAVGARAARDGFRRRRSVGLLRLGARGQERLAPDLRERDHGADRPLRLRQVDLPALPQPDERP